jgi:hypothetical protein
MVAAGLARADVRRNAANTVAKGEVTLRKQKPACHAAGHKPQRRRHAL